MSFVCRMTIFSQTSDFIKPAYYIDHIPNRPLNSPDSLKAKNNPLKRLKYIVVQDDFLRLGVREFEAFYLSL